MDDRKKLVKQAISHFRYGVSHDIFSEPVTTYAKLAIEALEKANGVTVQSERMVDVVEVVRCKDCIYSYEEFGFIYCTFGPYGDCKVPSQFYCAEGKRKRGTRGVE